MMTEPFPLQQATQFLSDPEEIGDPMRDPAPMEEPDLADAEEEAMAELWAADPGNQGA